MFALVFLAAVVIAHIDTGASIAHPHFANTHITGHSIIGSNDNIRDECTPSGHGTKTASVIVNNAPDAHLLIVKVADPCYPSYMDIAAGIVYAVDSGADIITIHFAGKIDRLELREAVDYAAAQGVIVVAAAGNKATDTPYYPAAYESVIAVGYDPAENDHTNYGGWVDVIAPCRAYVALGNEYVGEYAWTSGTSYAAPYHAAQLAVQAQGAPATRPQRVYMPVVRG